MTPAHAGKGELMPCPFCGREPEVSFRPTSMSETSPTGQIFFINCKCGTYSARAHQYGYTRDEANEKWNRRTPPSPPLGVDQIASIIFDPCIPRNQGESLAHWQARALLARIEGGVK